MKVLNVHSIGEFISVGKRNVAAISRYVFKD